MVKDEHLPKNLLDELRIIPFKQRIPWIGGDLQTLRDTFVEDESLPETGQRILIDVPSMPSRSKSNGQLIALLNYPSDDIPITGLVLMVHGLGGSTSRRGLRRMGLRLLNSGFAILRINLRGAGIGRDLAAGTYAAKCNSDFIPVLFKARKIAENLEIRKNNSKKYLPVFGVGISLGGTILLNACLELIGSKVLKKPILDGLVCISSPLDLAECSKQIEKPRNRIYQSWLLNRLVKQTIADPFGISEFEKSRLLKKGSISSIKEFDSVITAPRWGFKNVDEYYKSGSPISKLLMNSFEIPRTLLIQSFDDPWVPVNGARKLMNEIRSLSKSSKVNVLLTCYGGHNGFHGLQGCWGDCAVSKWLNGRASC